MTISHLRFGPRPDPRAIPGQQGAVRSLPPVLLPGTLRCAEICHTRAAIFLLNSIYGPEEVWDELPVETQQDIIKKNLRFYVIDAYDVAQKTGMGGRINTIMQTCFFAISGVLPREKAIAEIKHAIEKTYGKRGEAVVKANFEAVDQTPG